VLAALGEFVGEAPLVDDESVEPEPLDELDDLLDSDPDDSARSPLPEEAATLGFFSRESVR
jgi:hypothetical protein